MGAAGSRGRVRLLAAYDTCYDTWHAERTVDVSKIKPLEVA
ncbi:hypothetical protein SR870_11660 [Rhodopseudomonas palustris]|nr:hypothetical protein [Rhodopseudomonas palustris]WQH01889.1 hypothetical protein SR870_11660 [Rhodopseudomonas palustris]